MFASTIATLFVFFTGGGLATKDYADLASCLAAQRVIEADQQARGSHSVERVLCIPADARAY